MSTPTTPSNASLMATAFIACTNTLMAHIQGLGVEAPHNKDQDGELLVWCYDQYQDNLGTEWLAPFAEFVPPAMSFDNELEALLAGNEPIVVSLAKKEDLEALALEGMGLGEATGAGKGLQQGQEKEEGAKEKTPEGTAGAALGVAAPVMPKAPMDGAKGLALPVKKLVSPTKPASKRRGRQVPRYQVSANSVMDL
ncbi:hypothetical protein C0993_010543 [Termitomyces sp. T159_Od127]|nr:hypothetical protein C0993_010543 [Termitomyces sp. T159_Od127]